ncbi:carbohydrate ABC transporter permease [Paenibacillus contaminans]|uniref:Carbohydrate ABC transporter permease n=1 Tax=Paenibacillus contaminans TaxID=450362 RepID=A0A329LNM6_9BACL|nr:carbohydrate ABC transporter permease [Paenibacillus contaminans]RAV08313.1 carbohydrate ABC transporter permease [Paenibacillus contaminans]
MKQHDSLLYKTFTVFNYLFFALLVLICIYPFYYILIYSVSIPEESAKGGIYLWPKGFTLTSYIKVLSADGVARSFLVSAARVVIGTLVTLVCCSMFAYVLTHRKLAYRRLMYRMTLITMYLNGGIIPMYILMKEIGLKDNFLVYILPTAIVPFYIVLLRAYISSLPDSLEESAMIDGAGPFTVYAKIIMPLSMPVLATVIVFSTVNQWNSWVDNFFYVSDPKLKTFQLVLLSYLTDQTSNMMALSSKTVRSNVTVMEVTPTSIRMAITMIATLPVLFIYPYLQKYFISGMMVGAVKG